MWQHCLAAVVRNYAFTVFNLMRFLTAKFHPKPLTDNSVNTEKRANKHSLLIMYYNSSSFINNT